MAPRALEAAEGSQKRFYRYLAVNLCLDPKLQQLADLRFACRDAAVLRVCFPDQQIALEAILAALPGNFKILQGREVCDSTNLKYRSNDQINGYILFSLRLFWTGKIFGPLAIELHLFKSSTLSQSIFKLLCAFR